MAVERVQSAIARARAQRAGLETVLDDDEDIPMPDVDDVVVEPIERLDWNALPKSGMTARILDRARIVTGGLAMNATAFDMLRTKVLQRMRAEGWKRIAVTSADKSCGKSTVSLNLAFSLARQSELRAILVEADLRRPSLAKALRITPPAGLAQGYSAACGRSSGRSHLSTGLRAARVSSSRRRGAMVGALVKRAELPDSASVASSSITSQKRSRVCLLSDSVGSTSMAPWTTSGK